jgi:phosphoglycolate phosphatase-like HAD superfamily hydrolase
MESNMMDLTIFDFDGVVADSLSVAAEEVNALRSEFVRLPHISDAASMSVLYSGPLLASVQRFGYSRPEARRFFDLHSSAMRRRSGEVGLFADVVALIVELPRDRCALVTSAYAETVRRTMQAQGCDPDAMFRSILGRETGLTKEAKIKLLAEQCEVGLANVVHVGDMVSDLVVSRALGLRHVAAGWGYHPAEYLESFGPDELATVQQDLHRCLAA